MLASKLLSAAGGTEQLFVDDVFSTYLYTGTGSTQTITNGIDLAGEGGMVWCKRRNGANNHSLVDTDRGMTFAGAAVLASEQTSGTIYTLPNWMRADSTGFSLGSAATGSDINSSGNNYASWTFRKAPKFFDVVTFTTSASTNTNQRISHSLGQTPGMIILKATGAVSSWPVWHRSLASANSDYLTLNTTTASSSYSNCFGTSGPTASDFGINTNFFGTNQVMVAYLFAHDTSADGVIQCGSFTTDGSGNATVNLGWEPQYLMVKASSAADNWYTLDALRGWVASPGTTSKYLSSNLSATEGDWGTVFEPTATGFRVLGGIGASRTLVYLAIRRPNKPPTTGTQVYNAIARTGTGAAATVTGVGFAPDLAMLKRRDGVVDWLQIDRLRGGSQQLLSTVTQAEMAAASISDGTFFSTDMDGVRIKTDTSVNASGNTYINHFFKRAPGVFDICAYSGTGSATTVAHSLGVAPEMMIVKSRNGTGSTYWIVYAASMGNTDIAVLNLTDAKQTNSSYWNNTSPTASVFTVGTNGNVNESGKNLVAYLFATKAGISKVGSFTGNGGTQTIDCGFTTGARFVLIKRTDSTGDWYVWDTVRGIVAGNDPYLLINSTAAEVTSTDYIDPETTGFQLSSTAPAAINASGGSFIYLAFA